MCRLLKVSRSGYYEWSHRLPSKRDLENSQLLEEIKKSHAKSHQIYGVAKIHADVKEVVSCGKNRIHRIMKAYGIHSIRPRKYKATTNSRHNLPVAENLLQQNFQTDHKNQVFVSDISYISTDEGWLYLATVKDLWDKEIVGWAANKTMTKELAMLALRRAIRKRALPSGVIHHSDRGVQYASKDYQKLLTENHFIPSMSRKGNCYDNACAETFFSTIKNELIHLKHFKTREEARQAIFEYIEIFYNRQRRHEALNYLSPAEFRRRHMPKLA